MIFTDLRLLQLFSVCGFRVQYKTARGY